MYVKICTTVRGVVRRCKKVLQLSLSCQQLWNFVSNWKNTNCSNEQQMNTHGFKMRILERMKIKPKDEHGLDFMGTGSMILLKIILSTATFGALLYLYLQVFKRLSGALCTYHTSLTSLTKLMILCKTENCNYLVFCLK